MHKKVCSAIAQFSRNLLNMICNYLAFSGPTQATPTFALGELCARHNKITKYAHNAHTHTHTHPAHAHWHNVITMHTWPNSCHNVPLALSYLWHIWRPRDAFLPSLVKEIYIEIRAINFAEVSPSSPSLRHSPARSLFLHPLQWQAAA